MFWILIFLFTIVIGVKYYTAVGSRNLERRLNKIKADLEEARGHLQEVHEKEEQASQAEELAELRVRFMKELIQDIQYRLTQSDGSDDTQKMSENTVPAARPY